MEEFIRQLLQDQGVPDDLAPDVRTQLVTEMTERATDFVNKRLVGAMSEEALPHFESLLAEEPVDVARLQEFMRTNVPDQENVAAQALLEFRVIYLGAKA